MSYGERAGSAGAAGRMRRWACWLLLAAGMLLAALPAVTQEPRTAVVLEMDGAIGPASADYLERSLARAQAQGASLVILRMDTPGGLDTSMREMIRAILASPIPIATYVAPGGARAASAGTYILYASHVAAMAPGTNLGAATPVSIGGGGLPLPGGGPEPAGDADENGEEPAPATGDAMEAKVVNDAVAYIRGLAELRGRNADWAEQAVREAVSLGAPDALDQQVIDILAPDIPSLLSQAHGRTVSLAGLDVTLETEGLATIEIAPDWRNRLLAVLTNPNVALILMMIGIYGLIFEFMNPGALYPGTVGAICLLIGLYALALLPVTFAGAGLMVLGLVLLLAEALSPSFGVLGIGGVIAFMLGATILIDTDFPAFEIAWPTIAAVAVLGAGLSLLIARMAYTAHRGRVVSGREDMIGAVGEVMDWDVAGGHVFVRGERWRAVAAGPAMPAPGRRVRVTGLAGLTLTVEPEEPESRP